jgi:ferrochelatase
MELAKSGVKSLDVVCPSFAVDCLETLEEIRIESAEIFKATSGQKFSFVRCLNDSETHADFLKFLIARE